MKKLMIAAALAAIVSGGYAATLNYKDCDDGPDEDACEVLVFKLTASGKTVQTQDTKTGSYKAVKSLKISKGALAFRFNEECAQADPVFCCYETVDLFATVKVGSKSSKIAIPELVIGKWSIFGKNYENKLKYYLKKMKKGSSATAESDLFISSASAPGDFELGVLADGTEVFEDDGGIDIWAAAFGSMTAKLSKAKLLDPYCDPEDDCILSFTPKSYSGWFVGTIPLLSDGWCFNCECGAYDIVGGTWKATYQAKSSNKAPQKAIQAAQKLAFGKVLFEVDKDGNWAESDED